MNIIEKREYDKVRAKIYRDNNKNKLKERRLRDKAKIKIRQQKYYQKNKNKLKAKQKLYYQKNKPKIIPLKKINKYYGDPDFLNNEYHYLIDPDTLCIFKKAGSP